MRIEQINDTEIKIRRNQAFADVELLILTREHGEVIVRLDMESTIFVLENLDEGKRTFEKVQKSWFPNWRGIFKARR